MADQPTARDTIRRYVRLLADWWTPPSETDRRVEDVYQAVRAEVLTEAAVMLRAHCPQHVDGETAFMSCHCPAAVELDRAARTTPTT